MNIDGTITHGSAFHETDVPKMTTGSYTGNDTANRAIPHGLGRRPAVVIITQPLYMAFMCASLEPSLIVSAVSSAVTDPDATNFYVGNAANYANSANEGTRVYHWVAFG